MTRRTNPAFAPVVSIVVGQGVTNEFVLYAIDGNGAAIDISGAAIYMQGRQIYNGPLVWEASVTSVINGPGGIAYAKLVPADTASVVVLDGVWDAEAHLPSGDVIRFYQGPYAMSQQVCQ